MFSKTFLAAAFSLALLAAQAPWISGPVTGFVFDAPSHSIRLLLGVPGGAHLGTPVAAGIDFASVAPNGKSALAVTEGRVFLLRQLDGPQPDALPLEGAIVGADRIIWAPDASAALLWFSSTSRLQRWHGLDGVPAADPTLDLSSLPGTVTFLVANARADHILLGIADPVLGGIYQVFADAPPVRIALMKEPAAAAGDAAVLYAVDRDSRRVYQLRHAFDTPEIVPVLSLADGDDPVAVAVSNDGQKLYLANRTPQTLRVYDTASRAVIAEISLDAPPSFLRPLTAATFLLNAPLQRGEPLLLLGTRPEAAAYFVPAGE